MVKITDYNISFFDLDETTIIPVVQGDTGRGLRLTPRDWTIPSGSTAKYYVQKPSGNAVYYEAEVSGME